MQILLANAKIMFDKADRAAVSKPLFQSVAEMLAAEMAKLDVEELARQLDCSHKIGEIHSKQPTCYSRRIGSLQLRRF